MGPMFGTSTVGCLGIVGLLPMKELSRGHGKSPRFAYHVTHPYDERR
jgi:hypothetical protein